jgi:hypothetical protein
MSVASRLADFRESCRSSPDASSLRALAEQLMEAALDAPPDERAAVVAGLSEDVQSEAPGWVTSALIAGALVERGAVATELAAALLPKLGPLVERCVADLRDRLAEAPELGEDGEAKLGADLAEDAARPAFGLLAEIHSAAVAVLGTSVEQRRALAGLAPALSELEPFHAGAGWLRRILAVPDEEPLTVIHVPERRAFRCSMSGVARNFDLFVLLADSLAGDPAEGWLDLPTPGAELVACLAGDGPSAVEATYECPFNAYTYAALSADHGLPDPADYSAAPLWVWGEGEPWEIPILDGQRVLLLGPPSFPRVISVERTFPTLRAALVATPLSSAETAGLMERIARGNG